ncbi:hypothetical protein FPZ12_043790 [Amycolatopsis acidicola]|uniref:Uncharacterized protein n=1 Tax=Amycolatopsis acidicola TaxID=2596893 RepID=A0A5N0UNR1_9PSEU|nr:hypothetical protein [Amycolatopsis acidicola]KAA9149197.1 hypothetical protein FPZ12_043790 [Amycolatopsis acidicola]
MISLAETLSAMDGEQAARLRGLVIRQLILARRSPVQQFTLLHLFLVPGPGFALYEVIEPVDNLAPLEQITAEATEELRAAGDPRLIANADGQWQSRDPELRGIYVGTGARFTTAPPTVADTTLLRMADDTAVILVLPPEEKPLLQSSQPLMIGEQVLSPTREMPGVREPAFVLVDSVVEALRQPRKPFSAFG